MTFRFKIYNRNSIISEYQTKFLILFSNYNFERTLMYFKYMLIHFLTRITFKMIYLEILFKFYS